MQITEQWQEDVKQYSKESAALPFDLAAAKAGDAVEINANLRWKTCNSKSFERKKYPLIQLDYISVSVHLLRMKHPRRAGVDYSKFEESENERTN